MTDARNAHRSVVTGDQSAPSTADAQTPQTPQTRAARMYLPLHALAIVRRRVAVPRTDVVWLRLPTDDGDGDDADGWLPLRRPPATAAAWLVTACLYVLTFLPYFLPVEERPWLYRDTPTEAQRTARQVNRFLGGDAARIDWGDGPPRAALAPRGQPPPPSSVGAVD